MDMAPSGPADEDDNVVAAAAASSQKKPDAPRAAGLDAVVKDHENIRCVPACLRAWRTRPRRMQA